jgi:5'-nucleotidase
VEVKTAPDVWSDIDLTKTYTVGTISFLASGGDLYNVLKNTTGARVDSGFVDAEAFMEYAKDKGTLSQPADTGITYTPAP